MKLLERTKFPPRLAKVSPFTKPFTLYVYGVSLFKTSLPYSQVRSSTITSRFAFVIVNVLVSVPVKLLIPFTVTFAVPTFILSVILISNSSACNLYSPLYTL